MQLRYLVRRTLARAALSVATERLRVVLCTPTLRLSCFQSHCNLSTDHQDRIFHPDHPRHAYLLPLSSDILTIPVQLLRRSAVSIPLNVPKPAGCPEIRIKSYLQMHMRCSRRPVWQIAGRAFNEAFVIPAYFPSRTPPLFFPS
jgi:hypothetical protein